MFRSMEWRDINFIWILFLISLKFIGCTEEMLGKRIILLHLKCTSKLSSELILQTVVWKDRLGFQHGATDVIVMHFRAQHSCPMYFF